jgi:hypothetical protein
MQKIGSILEDNKKNENQKIPHTQNPIENS